MTCIVGLKVGDATYIGGDSAGVCGESVTIRDDEKVFHNGPFVIGFTSSYRMGQLLRYAFTPPAQEAGEDTMRFLVGRFIPAVKACLREGGYERAENGQESGGSFLLGYRGKLYHIDGDYQVGIPRDGIMAVGCGADAAMGALYALAYDAAGPDERLRKALLITSHLSTSVRPPFLVAKSPLPAEE